ncbi:MAG TPA: hypothetical protein VF472_12255 [Burkholderiaceae bacterium]
MQAGIINGARRGMSPAFDAEHALADQPGPDNDTSGLSALNATLEAQKNAAVMAAAQSLKMEGQDGPGVGDAQASAGNAAASAPAISQPISLGATPYPATANVPNPLLTAGVPGQVAPTDGATAAQIPLSNTPSNNGFIAGGPVAAGGMEAVAPNSPSSAPADPYDVAMLAAAGVRPVDAASNQAFAPDRQAVMDAAAGMGADSDGKDLTSFGAGADEAPDSRSSTPAATSPGKPLIASFDVSDRANHRAYLKAVNAQIASGSTVDPLDISTSKSLLFYYYGYPMGEQRGTTAAQLAGRVDDQSSPAFVRAITAFSQASDRELHDRYEFYSNIHPVLDANGNVTRGRYVDVTQDDRTIRITWDKTFASVAGSLGVSADEALRKTDFDVYSAAIDAAFKTDGVTSFRINGAWRPHPNDYQAITGGTSPLPNVNSPHISSRALDINLINGVDVNNYGYTNHSPARDEPDIVERFTDNLLDEPGMRQIFQPWRMWKNVHHDYVDNSDVMVNSQGQTVGFGNATLHKNHLHFGL